MGSLIILAALSTLVRCQLTQDTFNSIVDNAAEQAGIPECGVPCLLQAFEYSKLSRSCFVTSTSLSCLCDNEDIANGALSCASTVCGSTDTETFAERAGEICASRVSEIGGSQTTLMTAASSKKVLSTVVNDSTTMTIIMVANEPTTTSSKPEFSPDSTLKAQMDEGKIDALTTAAKAGIGAGAGLLALIAMLAAFLFIRKRKLDKNQQPLGVLPPGYEKGEQAELMGSPPPTDAGSKLTMSPMSEMGAGVFEKSDARGMGGDGQVQGHVSELASTEPVELPASQSYGDMRQAAAKEKMGEWQGGVGRSQSGPIPAAEELYPSPQSIPP